MEKEILVSPSILSGDFTNIASETEKVKDCGADWIHCDVMDGVFVPNITFGQNMIRDIKKAAQLPLDVHLMITEPIRYTEEFAEAGADFITVHIEACKDVGKTLETIKKCGVKAGLSVKPGTPVERVKEFSELLDLLLIMSVEPGFSGQKFIPSALEKTEKARGFLKRDVIIEVDGGVNPENAAEIIKRGADALVMGNAFFKAADPAEVVRRVKGIR